MRSEGVVRRRERVATPSAAEMRTAEKKLRLKFRVLRIVVGTLMLSGLLYQATGTLVSFLRRPTVVDVLIESTQTLRFPGISVCVTNWIKKDKLCERYPTFCNLTEDKIPELRRILDQDGNLGEIALDATDVIQTTIEDPTLYYYKFILEDKQIVQSFSRLPKYMCYTLNWKGNQEMSAYHEYPPLFDFSMFITWKISRLVSLDRYVADVGFHHVDSLDAGAKHTVILEPNGNYEYSIEQKGSIALPAPYDTNCVDYKMFGKHRFYPAYMTQTLCMEECRMNITFLNCGCIMKTYPFRNKLDEVMCDDEQTADCVLKRSKAIYDRVCREACRNPCEETTYDITLGYQSRESGVPFNGYYYLNMKLTIPIRYVAILKTIPMYTSTTVLAVIGGYLGFWLGLSMYSGVTKILLRVQAVIGKRIKDPLNRARSLRCYMLGGCLACLFRTLRLVCQAVCAAFCVMQARTDIIQYESYPTAVMYGYDRMTGIHFPAQRIVGAYLTVTVKLIEYSYARKDVIFDCKFVSGDAACQDFDCTELWQPSYTLAFETVCHTFDLARNRTGPYWDCPSPWKYSEYPREIYL
ncbi:hypothetical protein HPB50_023379 [Hyalomma asiaticum]|uniref:Uncharacterized protein n=1 Tax=Hyalomma asiaticum TaxID=266040 RepID=A0ACB7SI45_HYAAI|nr:hypothetical protein HPB50_023379 [Hyalomma asiaticum]